MELTYKYLYNKWVDGVFVLAPPFISLMIVAFLPDAYKYSSEMPVFAWVILIMCIDVAHVYSTLYRTYFDWDTYRQQRNLLLGIPCVCLLVSVLLYNYSVSLFWSLLAYLAVFHFIRQQYGFMRIYSGKEDSLKLSTYIDTITIYATTILPIIYWHLNPQRNFSWFMQGDFLIINAARFNNYIHLIYVLLIVVYVTKELYLVLNKHAFNVTKNIIIVGTGLSWYFGIVYFNGDLVFTLLNVIAHGIPYIALIWIWGNKKHQKSTISQGNGFLKRIFQSKKLIWFLLIILAFAYIEELCWDTWVWNEHEDVFFFMSSFYNQANDNVLKVLVPLLTLPQIVHYVIDGYIWKIKNDQFNWSNHVLK